MVFNKFTKLQLNTTPSKLLGQNDQPRSFTEQRAQPHAAYMTNSAHAIRPIAPPSSGRPSLCLCPHRKPQNWKPVLIVFLVFMCGQFSGFAVVTAYTVDIFNAAGSNMDPNRATVIVGLVR